MAVRARDLDVVATRYTYDAAVYVWPRVEERRELRVVDAPVPENHLDVMAALLRGYTGICNFNYKLRGNGELCIFEVNVRWRSCSPRGPRAAGRASRP